MTDPFDDLPTLTNVNWSVFDYPIGSFTGKCDVKCGDKCYIHRQEGSWTFQPLIDEDKTDVLESDMVDYKQFEKVYYARPGANDEENWTFLVKHQNGYYVYFDAGCDYTGFDCQGGGTITYSRDSKKMWTLGLTKEMRQNLG